MTAATDNIPTDAKSDDVIARTLPPLPVAAATHIFQGTLVAVTLAGFLVPASADPTLRVLGRAEEEVDNSSGGAGAKTCRVRRGIFGWTNSSSTSAVTDAHIGRTCYAVDDQTVSIRNPLGLFPVAGRVYDVDADGKVYVETGVGSDQHQGVCDLFLLAGADLSATGQNRFVKLDSAGDVVLAATAGMAALGVLLNAPTSGAVAIVRRRGPVRMLFEDASVEGALLAVAVTTGRAKTAVAGTVSTTNVVGSNVMGTALEESAGAGDLALVDLHPMGITPTTLA